MMLPTPKKWLQHYRASRLNASDLLVFATLIANGDMDNYYSGYFGVRQGHKCDEYLMDKGMSKDGAVNVWDIAADIRLNLNQEKANAQHRPIHQDSGS